MNLRHAAALVLVGWYLMMPPPIVGTHKPDSSAAMSEWEQISAFDTATECENFRLALREKSVKEGQKDRAAFELLERCIETTDPRLRAN